MIKKLLTFMITLILPTLSVASDKISYSGRLSTANGAPITGPVSLTLNIVTSTPSVLCTINDAAVPLSNGVFHFEVDYGSSCSGGKTLRQTLSDSIAASEELFIQVIDQTNSKTYPSQAITSTPLATVALEATSVTTESIVNTSLSGVAANCANNEVIAGDGSGNFKCIAASTGSVTSITAGTGLTGGTITSTGTIAVDIGTTSGKIPQLDGSGKLATSVETDPTVTAFAKTSLPTCGVGEVLKSDGTSFSCVTDDSGTDTDTTYTAGLGIDLTAGQFSIDASACAAGQRMIFGAPGFGCEDADAVSLQGNDVDNTSPNDNDVLTWNNTTSKWEPRTTAATITNLDDLADAATTTDNLFLGHSNTMGTSNTGVGITSLDALTTGSFNTSVGDGSLTANQDGANNVAVGYNAGASNISGNGNVFLGNAAGENETGSNKLYIDNSNTATPLIQGDFATDTLTINGTLKIVNGSEGATKVLTSSADGTATWTSLSGAGSVTSVDVAAPLVKSGTASDVDLSIPAATNSVNGYLTSTDWNTFNDKQPAITTGTTAQYLRGDLSLATFIDDVLASVLTGYTVGADSPLAATDSILLAFGKVQGQINDNNTDIAANAAAITTNATAISNKADKTITVNGQALSSNVTLDTDDVTEGTNKYFSDSLAKSAAVVNSTAGTETDQAASVAAMKSYVGSQTAASGDFMKDGSVVMTGSTKHSDGSEPLPSITFGSDTDTGIYSGAVNTIAISTGGSNSANFTSSTFYSGSTYGYSIKTTAGNQTLPTYSFNGDPDTGMYRSGTNQLSFTTQGNERLTILDDGKVGIGTSSPSTGFEIVNNATGDGLKDDLRVTVYDNTPSASSAIVARRARGTEDTPTSVMDGDNLGSFAWMGHDGTSFQWLDGIKLMAANDFSTSVDTEMTFHTKKAGARQDAMTINKDGNIGIRASAPTSQLHITELDDTWASSFRMDRSWESTTDYFQMMYDYEGLKIRTMDGDANAADIIFKPQDSEVLRMVASTGNTGIGVSDPDEKLEVNGNVKATAFYGDGSNLTGVSSSSSSNIGNATINADSDTNGSGDILFQTRGTTRASISNLGDMTIGTTLHTGTGVTSFSVGSATEPSVISLGEDTDNKGAITWDNTDNYVSIGTRSASTNYTDTLVVKDGKVGILTDSPDAALTIAHGNQNVNSKTVGLEVTGSYYINGGGNNVAGISSILTSRSGNINVPYISAVRGIQKCTPTTTSSCGDNYGGYFELSNDSTHATGTVSDGSAIYGLAKHTSTSVPTTKISAAELKVSVAASGIVTEANGVLVRAPANSGTITEFNGVSIDSLASIGTVTTTNAITYNHATSPFAVKADGKVGVGTSSPSSKLSVTGPDDSTTGPIVNIHGSINNQFEGGRIRFTENGSNLQGAYIHYDASSTNKLHIGMHETADSLVGSDSNVITLLRSNGRVGIGTDAPSEQLEVNGNVKAAAYLYTSDRRFKKNIETVTDPLEKVLSLRGVFFDWRNDEFDQFNLPSGKEYGFIAQEVEEIAPELVSTGDNGYKSVKYGNITSLLVEAFKSLENKISTYFKSNDQEVKNLNRKIASLEDENKSLKQESVYNRKRIEKMEKDLQLILKKMDK